MSPISSMYQAIVDSHWNQFLKSLPSDADHPQRSYEAFHFGTTAESAAELAALVLGGTKTATGSLQWVYEAENKSIPQVGQTQEITEFFLEAPPYL